MKRIEGRVEDEGELLARYASLPDLQSVHTGHVEIGKSIRLAVGGVEGVLECMDVHHVNDFVRTDGNEPAATILV